MVPVLEARLRAAWPKATVTFPDQPVADIPDHLHLSGMCLTQKRHAMFSLDYEGKLAPLRGLLGLSTDILPGEMAVLGSVNRGYNQLAWEEEGKKAFKTLQQGKMPAGTINTNPLGLLGRILAFFIRELLDVVQEFVTEGKGKNGEGQTNQFINTEAVMLLNTIKDTTKRKPTMPVVQSWLYAFAASGDQERANQLCKAVTGTVQELSGDNYMEIKPLKKPEKELQQSLLGNVPVIRLNGNILSVEEAGQFGQVPGEEFLEVFPAVQAIRHKESFTPSILYREDGIPFCYTVERGVKRQVNLPADDHDLLCTHHIGYGPPGCGKTLGFMSNMAVGFLKNGYSAFVVDAADGEAIDYVRDAIPDSVPDDHIIDLDLSNIKWPIAMGWTEMACRNMGDEIEQRRVANQVTAHLVEFITRLGVGTMRERMENYLSAAGKAVMGNPNNSILEVILALTAPVYLDQLLKSPEVLSQPNIHETLYRLHTTDETNKANITGPILNRLNVILSNQFLANLFLQRPKLDVAGRPMVDFRKWADGDELGPYFVGIRLDKDMLTPSGVRKLAPFVIQKLWLAILTRTPVPKNERRPCAFIMDEPHQYMTGSDLWVQMAVEARKYRLKLCWLAHGPHQFDTHLQEALEEAGCQYTVWKNSEKAYRALANHLAPFTAKDLTTLPKRGVAISKLAVSNIEDVPAFLGQMLLPPPKVKDRSARRLECSQLFGREVGVVEQDIYDRNQIRFAELESYGDSEGPEIDLAEREKPKKKRRKKAG